MSSENLVSTVSPQMPWCAWPSSVPSQSPTATRTTSSLRRSPHVVIGTAESHAVSTVSCGCCQHSFSAILLGDSSRPVVTETFALRLLCPTLSGWYSGDGAVLRKRLVIKNDYSDHLSAVCTMHIMICIQIYNYYNTVRLQSTLHYIKLHQCKYDNNNNYYYYYFIQITKRIEQTTLEWSEYSFLIITITIIIIYIIKVIILLSISLPSVVMITRTKN